MLLNISIAIYNNFVKYCLDASCVAYSPHKGDYSFIYHDMAKKLSLKPLGDRVVVQPSEKEGEKKLASGIIIPETVNKEKLLSGEVVAVGPGRRTDDGKRLPVEVKVGDTIFFKKPWDEPIKMNDVEYYVLSESDILFIA